MTELAGAELAMETGTAAARPCLCESYARVTERSALASARWLGRADQEGAEEAACAGMQEALEQLPIDGHIVIGASAEAGAACAPARESGPAATLPTSPSTRSKGRASSRGAAAGRCR